MKKNIYFLLFIFSLTSAKAQDDLMKELESLPQPIPYTIATFKGTRLINLHTIETLRKGSLDFRISHRFGSVSSGHKNLWGLDGPATLRLGLDYSFTDRLTIGVSRTSYKKMFEGFIKYKFLRQIKGGMPVSMTGITSANVTSEDDPTKQINGIDRYEYFSSRTSYVTQLMVARKFNSDFSLQLTPIFIHYNLVIQGNERNDLFALAASGRYKITHGIAVTAEYVYRVTRYSPDFDNYYNVVGIGCDIETGGHVFQLFLTNGSAINEAQLIPYTASNIRQKEYRFGFNISRVFEFRQNKDLQY